MLLVVVITRLHFLCISRQPVIVTHKKWGVLQSVEDYPVGESAEHQWAVEKQVCHRLQSGIELLGIKRDERRICPINHFSRGISVCYVLFCVVSAVQFC